MTQKRTFFQTRTLSPTLKPSERKAEQKFLGPLIKFHNRRIELHQGSFIDEMTVKWLSQTPNPPRIPVFYSLTKILKPTPVGRPIVAGIIIR